MNWNISDKLTYSFGLHSVVRTTSHFWEVREEEGRDEYEKGSHQHEDRDVERHCPGEVSREGVVSPLNHRHLALLVKEGQSVALVIDHESEDAEAVRDAELLAVGRHGGPTNIFSF